MKILIVEDDLFALSALKAMLQKGGHEIIEAKCRNEGVQKMSEIKPNLVITDTQMPNLLDTTEINRKAGVHIVKEAQLMEPPTRIWLVSSDMTKALQKEALAFGAEKALSKGIELLVALRAAKIIP